MGQCGSSSISRREIRLIEKKKRTIALVEGNEATLYSKNERRETGRIEGGIRSVGLNRRTEVAICGDCPHLSSLEERCGHLG